MIHKYKMNGLSIVMDVNGGSVHVVDDVTYDLLDHYEAYRDGHMDESALHESMSGYEPEEISASLKEVEELEKEGLLYTEDTYPELAAFRNRKPVIKALCLNIAHDCNLKCRYCFAQQGDFGGTKSLMPLSVGKRALEFLVENSGNRRNIEVDFFGGEPLMNFDVVKELVHYGNRLGQERNKNFRFTITTNGVLLDDKKIDFINEYNTVLSSSYIIICILNKL